MIRKIIILAILLLAFSEAKAQSNFLIPVTNSSGQAIAGATVTLTCLSGNCGTSVYTFTTDNTGNAQCTNVVAGRYTVTVSGTRIVTYSYTLDVAITSTLLNYQTAKAIITGNAADQAIYTYTLPASTVVVGKGLRITCGFNHVSGTASVTYKVKLNGATIHSNASAGTGVGTIIDTIMAQTSTLADSLITEFVGGVLVTSGTLTSASGISWPSSQVLEVDFNVANTDQVTPQVFVLEIIQ